MTECAVRHLVERAGVGAVGAPMSDVSNIEWTDATWNCLRGCEKVSPEDNRPVAEAPLRRLPAGTEHRNPTG